MPDLETVDLPGVELLATGGPVFGGGSPPEGDFWTTDDLEQIASANRELAAELQPPAKLGHAKRQALLADSGLTVGEMPAIGWADGASFRVSDDGTKLLADIRRVPKKLADLITAGAWRKRSVELGRITSQTTGKTYDWAVTAFAWLGGQLPAVRTLDDVVALYADSLQVEPRATVEYAASGIVWEPDSGFCAIRDRIAAILNPAPAGQMPTLYVEDVAIDLAAALVCRYTEADPEAWVVPLTVTDGTVTVASADEWTPAEKAWVATARELSARPNGNPAASADTPDEMPTFNAQTRRKFAEATGLEPEKVTDEMLAAAGVSEETTTPTPTAAASEDAQRALAAAESASRELAAVKEELRIERRDAFIANLIRDGKIAPGARAEWERNYDASADTTTAIAATLKTDPDLVREFGAEGGAPSTGEEREASEREYAADAAIRLGLTEKELI